MRPLDIYHLGVELSSSASSDAERRNVIGRLYYGIHHEACCRYFRARPNAPPLGQGSRHSALIDRYNQLGYRRTGYISRHLRRLSQLRRIADYELSDTAIYDKQSRTMAELMAIAINEANNVLTALEAFSPGAALDGCICRIR